MNPIKLKRKTEILSESDRIEKRHVEFWIRIPHYALIIGVRENYSFRCLVDNHSIDHFIISRVGRIDVWGFIWPQLIYTFQCRDGIKIAKCLTLLNSKYARHDIFSV